MQLERERGLPASRVLEGVREAARGRRARRQRRRGRRGRGRLAAQRREAGRERGRARPGRALDRDPPVVRRDDVPHEGERGV
jgi:hypothetical protein